MALVRGFKADAKRLAAEVREELGLSPIEPLDHLALAEHLCIPIFPMSAYLAKCPSLSYFTGMGQKDFSAITLFDDLWRMVIHNDTHDPCRQKSNIVHELAHALLQHPPAPPLNEHGGRTYDSGVEGEANWLAGELLITEKAALHIVSCKLDVQLAADTYGVCKKMMTFRLGATGAHARVSRFRKMSK